MVFILIHSSSSTFWNFHFFVDFLEYCGALVVTILVTPAQDRWLGFDLIWGLVVVLCISFSISYYNYSGCVAVKMVTGISQATGMQQFKWRLQH